MTVINKARDQGRCVAVESSWAGVYFVFGGKGDMSWNCETPTETYWNDL